MGDLGGLGMGVGLQDIVNQWLAGPPANDQAAFQEYAARLNDAELTEMLRQDREAHAKLSNAIARLQQLKQGDPPRSYDEAHVLQQGVDAKIAKLQYSANQAALDISARENEVKRRGTAAGGAPVNENLPPGGVPLPTRQSNPDPMFPPRVVGRPPSTLMGKEEQLQREWEGGTPANENRPSD